MVGQQGKEKMYYATYVKKENSKSENSGCKHAIIEYKQMNLSREWTQISNRFIRIGSYEWVGIWGLYFVFFSKHLCVIK